MDSGFGPPDADPPPQGGALSREPSSIHNPKPKIQNPKPSLHLQERFAGLLLIGIGLAVLVILFAFWRGGFETPVKVPLPAPMRPSMAFAFNPVVCAMPLISVGAVGLIVVGVRRLVSPES
ncbi:MAG: hypothetical protein HY690_05730 [Chloroflexi bacterium]|nr:hypothetical protein [Chloroflexota bacterium]